MSSFQDLAIPSTGSTWPRLGLGTWKTSPTEAISELVYHSLKTGYRHIDCAADYGNEKEVGAGIRNALDENIVKREELWVTSKLWNTYHRKEHVEAACRKTLADLALDYLDLYLIHFPMSLNYVPPEERYPPQWKADEDRQCEWIPVPLSETWAAMECLVDKGLVRHIGVSNFDLQLLQDLLTYCRIRPVVNQVSKFLTATTARKKCGTGGIELHPYLQQFSLVRFCAAEKIALTAYSPFGGKSYIELGMSSENEDQVMKNSVLDKISKSHGKSIPQVILRWVLQRSPFLTVIPKSSSKERIEQNINVFDFILSNDEMHQIQQLNKNKRYNDPAIYTERMGNYRPIFS